MPSLASKFRRHFFPTPHELEARRWRRDQGNSILAFNYPLSANSIVIDVGGFEGNWTAGISERYGCNIHVFEPVASFARAIEERFAGCPEIVVHAAGLAGRSVVAPIAVAGDASSVFRGPAQTENVQFLDIATWLDQLAFGHVDLIKVNIEGGEYDLIDRLIESGWHTRIGNLLIQFHDFVPGAEARMEKITASLTATHARTFSYRFVWENWRLKAAAGS